MKKSCLLIRVQTAIYLLTLFWSADSIAVTFSNSNFTMIDPGGSTFGGTNDIVAGWDGTVNTNVTSTNFNMTLGSASNYPFFGFPWSAHDISVLGPGSYSFDTTCSAGQVQSGMANCGGTPDQYLNLTVGAGQLGAHLLFNWNVSSDIDIAILWDLDGIFDSSSAHSLYQGPAGPTPAVDTLYNLVSIDGDGDGIPGIKMIDGPFIGFSANFNLREVPTPPAVLLFSTGLLGLLGIARRKT